ncbi:hypothetical protein U0C82_08210 [Fulvimarina sp. 2208YS6-2-32]|uniref:HTH HARE-type domain-containing protein n=1 Tax=Fulvimarina uroteuthidis TaxID=3098149 RepID=A0ABU5I160_9HYPH|nr:hypothetical protein [Fulvimarina sp. 2208YS6-2-32]MDY8109127.1 hypothetical protein [Fulvimarina sp. 2208YS6-2-32]
MSDHTFAKARELRAQLEARIQEYTEKLEVWKAERDRIDSLIQGWEEIQNLDVDAVLEGRSQNLRNLWGKTRFVPPRLISRPMHRKPRRINVETELSLEQSDRSGSNSRKEDVAAVARLIIMNRGRPVDRETLLHQLREYGLVIEGANPEKAMNTMLWRTREKPEYGVIGLRGYGYWLRERAYEPADYDPIMGRVESAENDAPDDDDDA